MHGGVGFTRRRVWLVVNWEGILLSSGCEWEFIFAFRERRFNRGACLKLMKILIEMKIDENYR